MDGKKLSQLVLDFLDEMEATDLYASQRQLYENLDMASGVFVRETGVLKNTVTINTVADQQSYDLPPDFIRPYMKTSTGRYFFRYYNADDETTTYPLVTEYDKIFKANLTDPQSEPAIAAIRIKETPAVLIEGTCDTGSEKTNGETTLTDATKAFLSTNRVYPRDIIHNISDESDGYVLTVTDDTTLITALWGGADSAEEWSAADEYIIQPAAQHELMLDAPSESDDHIITLPYICMPAPVFSDHGFWLFSPRTCRGICYGAAALFKKNKRDYSGSSEIGGLFDAEIRKTKEEIALSILQSGRRRSRS